MDDTASRMENSSSGGKRTRLVRSYPVYPLEEALAVARAIQESNAGLPFERTLLAGVLGTKPASSGYIRRLIASAKYGLTRGGYNDDLISLTPRGEAIVAPRGQEELQKALIEAAMEPDVFSRFYGMLEGKRLPEDAYAQNVLHREMGVHPDITAECLHIVKANGLHVGLISEVNGALYIAPDRATEPKEAPRGDGDSPSGGKIFIGHTASPQALRLVQVVLDRFEIPYSITEGDQGTVHPTPGRVSDEMRRCTAAILVFSKDDQAAEGPAEAMLYQLGAASALYGEKVIILKERGSQLGLDLGALHTVDYDRRRPQEAGLDLLLEMHRAGLVRVVASSDRASDQGVTT